MEINITVRLLAAPGVKIVPSSEEEIIFQLPDRQLTFEKINSAVKESLLLLRAPGATMDELLACVSDGPIIKRARLMAHLDKLTRSAAIWRTLYTNNKPLVSSYAISPNYCPKTVSLNETYCLSRFAYLRRDGKGYLLESPRTHAQAILHDWRAAALLLSQSGTEPIPGFNLAERQALFMFLAETGMATAVSNNGRTTEDNDEVLQQWEFHDLLFHSRSRVGRHANPMGITTQYKGKIAPQPMKKPAMSDRTILLAKPNVLKLMEEGKTFTCVLEGRRSLRAPTRRPITMEQLGEFVFRTCHVQNVFEDELTLSQRPYPSGGALHSLEIYLVIYSCDGLGQGFYRYCPHDHQLEQLEVEEEYQAALLHFAQHAQRAEFKPGVLFLFSARFQRVSWKYSAIAYALILKEVGALQQTMYLVAADMELAPCAIGAGDSDLFARATGLRYEIESTVGEFALH